MATINIQPNLQISKSKNAWAKGIAETIMQQMRCPNRIVYYSWGAEKFSYGVNMNGEPFLRFKVNGMKFKGYVWVVYDFSDVYKISFVSTHGNVKKEVEMVYCDQLQEIIDNYVEKINDYVY